MPEIDTSRAHPARMHDFLLGGSDHFEADREAIAALLRAVPNASRVVYAPAAVVERHAPASQKPPPRLGRPAPAPAARWCRGN